MSTAFNNVGTDYMHFDPMNEEEEEEKEEIPDVEGQSREEVAGIPWLPSSTLGYEQPAGDITDDMWKTAQAHEEAQKNPGFRAMCERWDMHEDAYSIAYQQYRVRTQQAERYQRQRQTSLQAEPSIHETFPEASAVNDVRTSLTPRQRVCGPLGSGAIKLIDSLPLPLRPCRTD